MRRGGGTDRRGGLGRGKERLAGNQEKTQMIRDVTLLVQGQWCQRGKFERVGGKRIRTVKGKWKGKKRKQTSSIKGFNGN